MKTAILADLHWAQGDPVKTAVLDWALAEVRREKADCIVAAGDMISFGRAAEARELRARLDAAKVPWLCTLGNAELRTPEESEDVRKIFATAQDNGAVILVDSTRCALSEADRARLAALPDGANRLLATHIPFASLPESDRDILAAAQARGAVGAVIAGHVHYDSPLTLRGLDPDKAQGGPPAIAFLERDGAGRWRRCDRAMPGVAPADWTEGERREFRDGIGLALMYEPVAMLEFAIAHKISAVELRGGTVTERSAELDALLKRWRERGGETLSLHLSELAPEEDGSSGELELLARRAAELGCQRVTLHVPKIRKCDFAEARGALLAQAERVLAPLADAGIAVGIENMHWKAGDTEETRRYGCTIGECREWLALMHQTLPKCHVGFHLDIGHARNNGVWGSRQPVGAWYAALGRELNGMHIHQVRHNPDGSFSNHQALTGFYDPLIALGGLFLAWRKEILNHIPMFLEILGTGGMTSYEALTAGFDISPQSFSTNQERSL